MPDKGLQNINAKLATHKTDAGAHHTLPATLDALGDVDAIAEARGMIIQRNATAWEGLAVGTDLYVLQAKGAGADVIWKALDLSDLTIPQCRVNDDSTQSINNASTTAINFDNEDFDTDTMHDTSTNNTRITFTTAGKYLIGACIGFAGHATGYRQISIRQDGSATLAYHAYIGLVATTLYMNIITIAEFSAAEYVELMVYQNSGAGLNTARDAGSNPVFWAKRIG